MERVQLESESPKLDPDEALKLAIDAAVRAGDYHRAEQLLAVLKAPPKPARILELKKGGAS